MRLSPNLIISLLPILCLTPASTARKAKRGCKASSSLTDAIGVVNLVAEPPITPTSSAITGLAVVQTSEVISLTDNVIESTDLPVSSTYNAVPSSTAAIMFNNTMTSDSAATTTIGVSSNDLVSPTVSPTTSGTTNGSAITGNKSGKAGVGWPVQEVDSAPVAQFFTSESAVSWWFNWNKNWNQGVMTSNGVSIDGEFVPMIFGPAYLDNDGTFQEGFTELMGYNEPDLKSTTGVSVYLEPAQAAETWKTQIVKIRQQYPDIKIHLPVVASNKTWLLEFFKSICPDGSASDGWGSCQYKPDYVSAHLYTTDLEYFKGTLAGFQKDFGLPLVLSEFACYKFGEGPHPSLEEVSTFMQDTMEWLDQQDWVVKYAWFGNARNSEYLFGVYETNRLMDISGVLTDLGKQYVNGGKPIS
ncbi:uncharacterized protein L199_000672 [Kwoniella botswanensis]|uniref:uncharacterized protein n=1 Tax=Kwoniella botswanensis TaxID=1268659 RepID=UPI00315D264A